MSWRKKVIEHIVDALRYTARIFVAFDIIILSLFLFWFVIRFIWRLAQYIDHRLFSEPWF
ncbi:MAG: hypothetical protein JEZ07_14600 [Phycisphaerae bacterium]|nr:hypothetical protein [Phycisphaerae bacterium]